ncbi:MAG: tRNA (N6-isopentenyl adenosine(37)-C2)-methylthiotransferase MiaB [Deltaproteobacteria bacterium]|nr:tRNA (N6-isopentenyl adenosine(37)-C2)-methylthiotransferase MiaB [Deltaproteobacteria bacterium]MBW1818017.1 tRNA (N6-isopentenyl adenosine(37)-C2)-methylthiotransferase MiaB [Deltaproteobacteria bacterium]
MNDYDSDFLSQTLIRLGLSPTGAPEDADLVLVNTCTVREKAEQKACSLLGRMSRLKKKKPELTLGVAGCLAQHKGKQLMGRFPEIDFVMGPRDMARLPEILDTVVSRRTRVVADRLDLLRPEAICRPGYFQGNITGQIAIMEGCNNFCSYCIVPFVRGRETSRSPGEIIQEAEYLVSEGVGEITLLGQNVNSYRWESGDIRTFTDLLKALNRLSGLLRLRFTTSHPKDLGKDLIQAFGELEHLCPHIHLPFQAGSNRVLHGMNRRYTREHYMALIHALRDVRPDMAVTSDVMVGFPGETEPDFLLTMDLIERVGFDNLYSFQYSDRKGAAAANMDDKIDDREKASRLARLQARQKQITLEKNNKLVGHTLEVLIEGESRRGDQLSGRTATNKVVNFKTSCYNKGSLIQVIIVRAAVNSLTGEVCVPEG